VGNFGVDFRLAGGTGRQPSRKKVCWFILNPCPEPIFDPAMLIVLAGGGHGGMQAETRKWARANLFAASGDRRGMCWPRRWACMWETVFICVAGGDWTIRLQVGWRAGWGKIDVFREED